MKKWMSLILSMVLTLCAALACAESFTYADTIAWDGEYDVVVIGFGAAGATAAVSAADAGAQVLLTEKCNENEYGGNTRYCGQLFFVPNTYEIGMNYYKSLSEGYDFPEELFDVLVKGELELVDWFKNTMGVTEEILRVDSDVFSIMFRILSPEYPEKLADADDGRMFRITADSSRKTLFQAVSNAVNQREANIDVWYEAPATHLIQDPFTKTIIGVEIEKQGKTVKIRATNGVVLATGGFENNAEMIETYLGLTQSAAYGGQHNTGDGLRMAQEVGAKMWHMDVFEGAGVLTGAAFKTPEGSRANALANAAFVTGPIMAVGNDGSRYMNEYGVDGPTGITGRHSHMYYHGTWNNSYFPEKTFIVFNQEKYDEMMAANLIPEIAHAEMISGTAEEVCAAAGFDLEIFKKQIADFDAFVADGEDKQYGRDVASMAAFGEGPYYVLETIACILNTQGGPMKNTDAQVLDVNDNPIPNLYIAGELGGITAYQYQGGTNIAECLVFGQIAGKNAAAVKEPLPALELKKVESNLVYMPNSDASTASAKEEVVYELNQNEAIGESEKGMGGKVVVKVTFEGETITAIEVLEQNETAGISDPAFEKVPAAIIEAQSAEVDGVAGATMTSNALKEAVQTAIDSRK